MGKSIPSSSTATTAKQLLNRLNNLSNNNNNTRVLPPPPPMETTTTTTTNAASSSSSGSGSSSGRLPLGEVVSDCVKRWFKDTLKEAKSGDINMQVLLGQMYYSGYGIPRDPQKGRMWITRASRTRSTVWKVSDKHPGYNASDSDSDELKVDS